MTTSFANQAESQIRQFMRSRTGKDHADIALAVIEDIAASNTQAAVALRGLQRIGYEPFGPADATDREVLDAITAYARSQHQAAGDACKVNPIPDCAKAIESLLNIIHDDLTHAAQRHHAEALAAARAVLAKVTGGN